MGVLFVRGWEAEVWICGAVRMFEGIDWKGILCEGWIYLNTQNPMVWRDQLILLIDSSLPKERLIHEKQHSEIWKCCYSPNLSTYIPYNSKDAPKKKRLLCSWKKLMFPFWWRKNLNITIQRFLNESNPEVLLSA